MIARTKVTRAFKIAICVFAGLWLAIQLTLPLDDTFTGAHTITSVSPLFGAWAGLMIGGGELAAFGIEIRKGRLSRRMALALAALGTLAGAVAVLLLADSSTRLSGTLLGLALGLHLFTIPGDYRYIFAALILGIFVGTGISAAGGLAQIERVIQVVIAQGLQGAIESGHDGVFRHSYLGRDRGWGHYSGIAIGLVAGAPICLIASFCRGYVSIIREGKAKRKPKQKTVRAAPRVRERIGLVTPTAAQRD